MPASRAPWRTTLALPLVALLGAAALVAGCATESPAAAEGARLATYIGRTEAELVSELGVPNRSYETEDGRRLLQYDTTVATARSAPVVTPSIGLGIGRGSWGGGTGFGTGIGIGLGGYAAPVATTESCSNVFEIRDGRVIGLDRRGLGCD